METKKKTAVENLRERFYEIKKNIKPSSKLKEALKKKERKEELTKAIKKLLEVDDRIKDMLIYGSSLMYMSSHPPQCECRSCLLEQFQQIILEDQPNTEERRIETYSPKCECGAASLGYTGYSKSHADYCPLRLIND